MLQAELVALGTQKPAASQDLAVLSLVSDAVCYIHVCLLDLWSHLIEHILWYVPLKSCQKELCCETSYVRRRL